MTQKTPVYLLLLISIFTTNFILAQGTGRQILFTSNKGNFYSINVNTNYQKLLSPHFRQYKVVKLRTANIAAVLKEANYKQTNLGLQINDTLAFNLQLEKNELLSYNYILTAQTPNGKLTSNARPSFFYKGKVNGAGGGDARLCIKEGFMYGYIKKAGKEYFIEPVSRYDNNLPTDEFIFYEAADVIATDMTCGSADAQAIAKTAIDQSQNLKPVSPDSTGGAICKRVKFFLTTDYSMYKAFNGNVSDLETFLLANLNMAEGLFNTLNLDSTVIGDVGNDALNFEVTQIHTATCDSCNFMPDVNITTNAMSFYYANWLDSNTTPMQAFIYEYWSTRKLGTPGTNFLGFTDFYKKYPGCFTNTMNFIRYFTQNAITLRLQVAHEAGHSFGCQHDNDVSSSVRGFIMNAGGTYSPTGRFSRLSDFGGINYSSQQTIAQTVERSTCFETCSLTACEAVTGLEMDYYSVADSTKISWTGNGSFLVKYKLKEAGNYDSSNQFVVDGNELVLKNILSCTNYTVAVQKICDGNSAGSIASITFNSSPFGLSANAINKRGDVYDLKLQLECKNCNVKNVVIKFDHHPYTFHVSHFPSSVVIVDLFADGATHRIDYTGDDAHGGCDLTHLFKAPYYRENSIKLIAENFDGCKMPVGWKDSALKIIPSYAKRSWNVAIIPGEPNVLHGYYYPGSFDSTCMLYNDYGSGAAALISPPLDMSKLTDCYLSFDYNYFSFAYELYKNLITSSFKVQVLDGVNWTDIFLQNKQIPYLTGRQKTIWDTIPSRVFIKLDRYLSDKVQVRFVIDDGANLNPENGTYPRANQVLYVDNIRVDGYDKSISISTNSFTIFPNPANDYLLIKLNTLDDRDIIYKLTDALGRTVQQNKLVNYKINVSSISSGIYFLTLYNGDDQIGKTQKFFKR